MKIKRKQVLDSVRILERIKSEKLPIRTSFKLVKIIRTLREEAEAIQEAIMANDEIRNFEAKRMEILRKYARKDQDGNPITLPNGLVDIPPEDMPKVDEEMKKLNEEYPDVTPDKIADFYNQLNSLLEEEIEKEIEPIPIEEFESITITPADLDVISFIIKE